MRSIKEFGHLGWAGQEQKAKARAWSAGRVLRVLHSSPFTREGQAAGENKRRERGRLRHIRPRRPNDKTARERVLAENRVRRSRRDHRDIYLDRERKGRQGVIRKKLEKLNSIVVITLRQISQQLVDGYRSNRGLDGPWEFHKDLKQNIVRRLEYRACGADRRQITIREIEIDSHGGSLAYRRWVLRQNLNRSDRGRGIINRNNRTRLSQTRLRQNDWQ